MINEIIGYKEKLAVWSLILFFLAASTRFFSFWEADISVYDQDQSSGDIFVIVFGCISLCINYRIYLKKKISALPIVKNIWPFIILLIYIGVSCTWSEMPLIAIRRYFKLLIMIFCVFNLSLNNNVFRYFISRLLGTLLISSFLVALTPYGWMSYNNTVVLRGIMGHKSGFADLCAVSFLLILWYGKSLKSTTLLILFSISLLLTTGKNPLICLIVSLSFMGLFSLGQRKRVIAITVSIVLLVLCMICWAHFCWTIENIFLVLGKDNTFTGRTDIWSTLIGIGLKTHPFLGSGFGSFFVGDKSRWLLKFFTWEAPDAHSGYLKIFLEEGYIGLFLFFLYIAISLFSLIRLGKCQEKIPLMALFIYTICYNIVSNSFMDLRISFLTLIWLSIRYSTLRIEMR